MLKLYALYFSLALCFLSSFLRAQAPSIEWEKSFGGTTNDDARNILPTADGGHVIIGNTVSVNGNVLFNHGNQDVWLVKIDASGTIQWQKSYGGTGPEYVYDMKQTSDGGYIFTGMSSSVNGDLTTNNGYYDCWIVKIDAAGTLQWQKSFGGTAQDQGNSVAQTLDGGYIIAGETSSTNGDFTDNHGASDSFVIRLDDSGNLVWKKCIGGTASENAKGVVQAADGNFIIASTSNSLGGQVWGHTGATCSMDYWIVKLDLSGNFIWNKCFGGLSITGSSEVRAMIKTNDGGYLISGITNANHGYQGDFFGFWNYWVVKLNAAGTMEWQKMYGGNQNDMPYKAIQTSDGNYVVAGFSYSSNGHTSNNYGGMDYWIFKIDPTGNLLWQKSYGGSDLEEAHDIVQTIDGGYIVVGQSYSSNIDITTHIGGYDYWVVKLGADFLANKNFNTADLQVYPNPTTGLLHINCGQPVENVMVYDLNGRLVLESNQKDISKISLEPLEQGTYFVRINTNTDSFTKKIVKE